MIKRKVDAMTEVMGMFEQCQWGLAKLISNLGSILSDVSDMQARDELFGMMQYIQDISADKTLMSVPRGASADTVFAKIDLVTTAIIKKTVDLLQEPGIYSHKSKIIQAIIQFIDGIFGKKTPESLLLAPPAKIMKKWCNFFTDQKAASATRQKIIAENPEPVYYRS